MAYTAVSGNSGRIYIQGTSTALAGIAKWSMKKNTKTVQLLHFESPIDGDLNIWEQQLQGASSGDISLEGWIDTASVTATDSGSPGLRNGLQVIVSLILFRGTPWGFNQVIGQIADYEVTSAIDSDKPATFKATLKTSGIVGSTQVVTG